MIGKNFFNGWKNVSDFPMIGKILEKEIVQPTMTIPDNSFCDATWDGGSNTGRPARRAAAEMRLRTGCGWDRVCNVSPKRGFPVRGDGHLNGLLTQISRSQGIWNIST